MLINETVKAGTKIGAVIGSLVAAVGGIMPGIYFGGYGAIILLSKFGTVEPSLFVRFITVCGMLVGVACISSISIILGSLLGAAIGFSVTKPISHFLPQKA